MLLDQLFRTKRSSGLGEAQRCELACVADYERCMVETVDRSVVDYCRGGAASESTIAHNRTAFERLRIRPRCLQRLGGTRSLAVTSLGTTYKLPIGIAPVALQRLAHPDGEAATAKAARTYGVPFVLSVLSSVSIEELAEAVPRAPKWFQLYIFKDRELTECLVRRAEKARFRALVVSVDCPAPGLSRAERRNPLTLPPKVTCANFVPSGADAKKSCSASVLDYVRSQFDPGLGWDAIRWLMSITSLPVIVKGILHRTDALIAADIGVHGLIVSNCGGRQLDCAPAALEVLPEIVHAVGDRLEVMLDSGVTQGTDVFKALALGARLVFVGRAPLYGLAVNGQRGVEEVLEILKTELESTMLNAGCGTVTDLTPQHVCHEMQFYHPPESLLSRGLWRNESGRTDRYRTRERVLRDNETVRKEEVVDVTDAECAEVMLRGEPTTERVAFQQRSVDERLACPEGRPCGTSTPIPQPPPYRNVPLLLNEPRGIYRSNTNNLRRVNASAGCGGGSCGPEGLSNLRTAKTIISRRQEAPKRPPRAHSMQNLCGDNGCEK
ncbi:2-Hydroxyacid oxidase 1-like [Anopheles bellator]|uniref:2-Hydroxyacid oxidase 1-like n=1 Tax=Anopheles bellator TaxID=139047 RepID=UPI002647C45C|nr:2-Hydroxyacid oxidase 1-like [Anopheles bellator]